MDAAGVVNAPTCFQGVEPYMPHAAGEPERVAGFPALRLARLHRDSLTNVLVLGRPAARREAVARTFHLASPVRRGPFVRVHCGREAAALTHAIGAWLGVVGEDPAAHPLCRAECGTLYLDNLQLLPLRTQRMLLTFARRLQDGQLPSWTGRLIAGAPAALKQDARNGRFLRPLYDCLDKVRIELASPALGERA